MPSHFKQLVRARMAKTGESYQTASRHVRAAASEPNARAFDQTTKPSDDAAARIGTVIAGRYRLTSVLSRETPSSHAVVYRAEGTLLGGQAEIKLLPKAAPAHFRAWILREGRALRRAQHPQVIQVLDIGETEAGDLYLALEPAPETTLDRASMARSTMTALRSK